MHYEWTLKGTKFKKNRGTVFSCFSGGGGSSLGYKLAGFDVIGCNELDPRMMDTYLANNKPKYAYCESITDFRKRRKLPPELFNLDILDGSPPCSSFSMVGSREKDWGKKKKFREGQAAQVLDTLFFEFIRLAKRLQPKIIVAENVKGLIQGKARAYADRITSDMEMAGYKVKIYLLDASKMGVPQKRERVFFVGVRKDLNLAAPILEFCDKPVPFKLIRQNVPKRLWSISPACEDLYHLVKPGEAFSKAHPKGHFFSSKRLHKNKVISTILPKSCFELHDHKHPRRIILKEGQLAQTFPLDYDFRKERPFYVIGMSVPPLMTARVAIEVYKQVLSKAKRKTVKRKLTGAYAYALGKKVKKAMRK